VATAYFVVLTLVSPLPPLIVLYTIFRKQIAQFTRELLLLRIVDNVSAMYTDVQLGSQYGTSRVFIEHWLALGEGISGSYISAGHPSPSFVVVIQDEIEDIHPFWRFIGVRIDLDKDVRWVAARLLTYRKIIPGMGPTDSPPAAQAS